MRPAVSRLVMGLAVSVMLAGIVQVFAQGSWSVITTTVEQNTDRPGGDFTSVVPRGGLEECRRVCQAERACVAYTFVKPGASERLGICWLKSRVTPAVASDCCTSGLKSTGERITSPAPPAAATGAVVTTGAVAPVTATAAATGASAGTPSSLVTGGQPGSAVIQAATAGAGQPPSTVVVAPPAPPPTATAAPPNFMSEAAFERATDRPGSDYRDFATPSGLDACRLACFNDARCRAFTYVLPGGGNPGHCWLKSSVPATVANPRCVSGVKR